MRRIVIAAVLSLLAGCQKSFDERYADAGKKIRGEAVSIDRELGERASQAAPAVTATDLPRNGARNHSRR
ncbi:MAG: hypothetical protein LBV50_07850 [Novosphingobium sp.]|jgi:hypothetical protein|nr:hypothetical protein [Novosphingobium sp.]